jgi:NADPH:quinone reductase-like Zn-dependent oxidoreductase
LARSGIFKVLVDRVLPLREAAAAHRLVEASEPLGKVILDPTVD